MTPRKVGRLRRAMLCYAPPVRVVGDNIHRSKRRIDGRDSPSQGLLVRRVVRRGRLVRRSCTAVAIRSAAPHGWVLDISRAFSASCSIVLGLALALRALRQQGEAIPSPSLEADDDRPGQRCHVRIGRAAFRARLVDGNSDLCSRARRASSSAHAKRSSPAYFSPHLPWACSSWASTSNCPSGRGHSEIAHGNFQSSCARLRRRAHAGQPPLLPDRHRCSAR